MTKIFVSYRLSSDGQKAALLAGQDACERQEVEMEATCEQVKALGDHLSVDTEGKARVYVRQRGTAYGGITETQDAPLTDIGAVIDALGAIDRQQLAQREAEEAATRERDRIREEERSQLRADILAGRWEGIRLEYGQGVRHSTRLREAVRTRNNDEEVVTAVRAEEERRKAEAERRKAETAEQKRREHEARRAHLARLAKIAAGEQVLVSVPFEYGNPRRYGRPWIGLVTDLTPTGKPGLEWGMYEGEKLTLSALPGSLVMYGQRDHRREDRSIRQYAVVEQDGALFDLRDRAEAISYWHLRA